MIGDSDFCGGIHFTKGQMLTYKCERGFQIRLSSVKS